MQFDRKAKESLILGAVGTLLLAFGLANHGLPDSLFTDRSKPLDDDPQVVRVMKAQFAEAESKNDVMVIDPSSSFFKYLKGSGRAGK